MLLMLNNTANHVCIKLKKIQKKKTQKKKIQNYSNDRK